MFNIYIYVLMISLISVRLLGHLPYVLKIVSLNCRYHASTYRFAARGLRNLKKMGFLNSPALSLHLYSAVESANFLTYTAKLRR